MTTINFSTKTATFTCHHDCTLGAYVFYEGEPMKIVADGEGKFELYVAWGQGYLGSYTAEELAPLTGVDLAKAKEKLANMLNAGAVKG